MEKKEKISFINSISFKILLLIVCIVIYSLLGSVIAANFKAREIVATTNENYIMSITEQAAQTIKSIPPQIACPEEYAGVMQGIKMKGVDSAYAYLVSADGTMIFHPVAEKIGQQVENAVIKEVVAKMQSGSVPANEIAEYDYKGQKKYAGYAIANDMIVVVTADKKEIISPVDSMLKFMTFSATASLVISLLTGYFFSLFLCRPLHELTRIIADTANLDFSPHENAKRLRKRKDETGLMAREVHDMRRILRDMVTEINHASLQITTNVDGLKMITNTINGMCTDNSATTQQLAAGMEETAASTITINQSVQDMKKDADSITAKAKKGAEDTNKVMDRAKNLGSKTEQATDRTMTLYESVKEKSKKAIEGSKAVDKINELTDSIMEISAQTGLLALNASIEAARAGEAGKGFAVVATEIGSLADQTSKAVENIGVIVQEVNTAVSHMTECMEETTDFLETTVIGDYKEFKEVSIQYQEDAVSFGKNMNEVRDAMMHLSALMDSSAQSLENIKDTVNEAATGVSDIAEKTSDMVDKTSQTYEMVDECYHSVDKLKGIVNQFKLP